FFEPGARRTLLVLDVGRQACRDVRALHAWCSDPHRSRLRLAAHILTRFLRKRSLFSWDEGSRSSFLATPTRPPLDALKKRLDRSRSENARMPRDGFLRETFVLPRLDARQKARE